MPHATLATPIAQPTYHEMLTACRSWLAANHPEAEYASVVVHLNDEVPDLVIPFFSHDPACSSPCVRSS